MAIRRPPEVRPLRVYRCPGYPAASELDEALRQRPVGPWPWATPPMLLSLVAASAASACARPPGQVSAQPAPAPAQTLSAHPKAASPSAIASSPITAEPAPPEPKEPAPPPPAASSGELPNLGLGLKHPFSWEASQWPIEWHPYGTGEPARLSEQQVRPVVERVLRAAGIRTSGKTLFDRPQISVQLDGYDASRHVGWMFVEWQKLEDPLGWRGGKLPSQIPDTISHAEVRRILELEKNGSEHIILISYQDDRFSLRYDSKEPFPDAALRRLEVSLRAYLGWLHTQGGI